MAPQALIDMLTVLAKDETWGENEEDFVVDDYAGGNVDDAYQGGIRTGRIELARELLTAMGVEY